MPKKYNPSKYILKKVEIHKILRLRYLKKTSWNIHTTEEVIRSMQLYILL